MSDPDLSVTPQDPHWPLREPDLPPPLVKPHREDERVGACDQRSAPRPPPEFRPRN